MERHLATVWESVADAVGDEVALVQGETRRTWADFDGRSARLAGALAAAGLGPGSKVAEYLYNAPEYLETYYAALKLRAVPVNVNYRYLDDELLYLLDNSDAEALVFHASLGERAERIRDRATKVKAFIEVDDGDGAGAVQGGVRYEDALAGSEPARRVERAGDDITMTYTGGTTGLPKGVMTPVGPMIDVLMATTPPLVGLPPLSDPAGIASLAAQAVAEGRSTAALPACPLMHATGLAIGALPALTFGGRVVLLEGSGLDAGTLWSLVEEEGVHALTIVGDSFARPLLRELRDGPERNLGSMMLLCSSGAMFSTEVKEGLLEHIPQLTILDFIAATEGTMGISISTKDNVSPTGRFLPDASVRVLTEDGRQVQAGSEETGMVAIAGIIPDGYYKDEAKTAATFREIDGVRYSIPGDWAKVNDDGTITLLGRGSQVINTGGEKVYPEEVEETVKALPAVEDCLIFGVVDERFGQKVVGVASLATGQDSTAEEVVEGVRDRLSSYKLPRRLVLVEDVPRAPNGKADLPAARRLFEEAAG